MRSESPSVSSISRPGAIITTVSADKESIPCKIKRNKISKTLIKGKESIQEPNKPSKRTKKDSIIDEKKETPPPFKNKVDYIDGTNEKTCESNDSPSYTDGFAKNLGDEHKNEEEEE